MAVIDFTAARRRMGCPPGRPGFNAAREEDTTQWLELDPAEDIPATPRASLADILRQCAQSVDPDIVVESLLPGGR